MKKLFAAVLAAALVCGVPVFADAPQVPSADPMPAAWLDPIRVPDASSVMAVYRYDKSGRSFTLRSSAAPSAAEAVCGALSGLKAGEVILNVPNVSFVPVDRCPGDTVYELRTGNGESMRYYVDSSGFIISQRIEEGMMYQGMKFSGGNTAEVIDRLNALSDYENTGTPPFEIPMQLEGVKLYNYIDMTCTRILSGEVIRRVQDLLYAAPDPYYPEGPASAESFGDWFRDIHEMTLVLSDGTDLTLRLFEDGVQVLSTDESLNVPREKNYYLDPSVCRQLVDLLRAHQSACSPAWLHAMDTRRVTSVTLTAPDGREKKFLPGGREFSSVLSAVRGITVEPLSFQERSRRSFLDGACTIRIELNDDRVFTVDYGNDAVEVEVSNIGYIASYTLARGYRDGVRFLESLI